MKSRNLHRSQEICINFIHQISGTDHTDYRSKRKPCQKELTKKVGHTQYEKQRNIQSIKK